MLEQLIKMEAARTPADCLQATGIKQFILQQTQDVPDLMSDKQCASFIRQVLS